MKPKENPKVDAKAPATNKEKDAKDAKDRKPTPKDQKKILLDKKGKPIIPEPEPEVKLPPLEKESKINIF